jgi:hypothetical protein
MRKASFQCRSEKYVTVMFGDLLTWNINAGIRSTFRKSSNQGFFLDNYLGPIAIMIQLPWMVDP